MHIMTNEISISERESKLWLASHQYMRGEISLNMLEAIEQNYALASTTSGSHSSRGNFLFRYLKKAWLQFKNFCFNLAVF